jgi:hypothetical protein
MTPWFIATEPFAPSDGDTWSKYIAWSNLTQLEEVVSLDPMLCPSILKEIKDEYWPHIVNENFMLNYFTDLEYLESQLGRILPRNLLCVFRNPETQPVAPSASFEFMGYDLVDIHGSASALTNCGGFGDVFSNSELSPVGLLTTYARALQVQSQLRLLHSESHHANCHVWAIFRAFEP